MRTKSSEPVINVSISWNSVKRRIIHIKTKKRQNKDKRKNHKAKSEEAEKEEKEDISEFWRHKSIIDCQLIKISVIFSTDNLAIFKNIFQPQ